MMCKVDPFWLAFLVRQERVTVLLDKPRPLGLAEQVIGPGMGHLYMLNQILRLRFNKEDGSGIPVYTNDQG